MRNKREMIPYYIKKKKEKHTIKGKKRGKNRKEINRRISFQRWKGMFFLKSKNEKYMKIFENIYFFYNLVTPNISRNSICRGCCFWVFRISTEIACEKNSEYSRLEVCMEITDFSQTGWIFWYLRTVVN